MVLSCGAIDFSALRGAFSTMVDLDVMYVPAGKSPFEIVHLRQTIEQEVESFHDYVEDNEDRENEMRRALGWILNLKDDALLDLTKRLRMPYPNEDAAQRRRVLEMFWTRTFADWMVDEVHPEDFVLVGLSV